MHLIDDELLARPPMPRTVGPKEVLRIDNFRRSVRSFRLKSRRRVGQCLFTPIETEAIAHAGSRRQAPQCEVAFDLGLQCRWLEAFDLDNNLAAFGRPNTEMDAAVGLRLRADRQAPDGRRFGRERISGSGKLGRRRRFPSLLGEAEAGASVHVATSRFAYEPLPCAPGRLTTPAVIRSSPSNSDGTRSGSFIVVVDRTTSRMAVAI
jgi:hypothetical protein